MSITILIIQTKKLTNRVQKVFPDQTLITVLLYSWVSTAVQCTVSCFCLFVCILCDGRAHHRLTVTNFSILESCQNEFGVLSLITYYR